MPNENVESNFWSKIFFYIAINLIRIVVESHNKSHSSNEMLSPIAKYSIEIYEGQRNECSRDRKKEHLKCDRITLL